MFASIPDVQAVEPARVVVAATVIAVLNDSPEGIVRFAPPPGGMPRLITGAVVPTVTEPCAVFQNWT